VRDPATGKIVAGARRSEASREFADSELAMLSGVAIGGGRSNTTLAVVATNASLDKVRATKLAQLAGLGMARTIYPVNTMVDGDTVFALSLGTLKADINNLGVAAAHALSQAILRAVRSAKTLAGFPGLAG
jgi:L-aminopeptidase/D-esterase-like protein